MLRAILDWLTTAETRAQPKSPGAVPLPDGPPARIGHYTITGRLGQGGMGVVYAARDEKLGRAVALKTMVVAKDDVARQRFWREARAAASVNHPNVCQLYEIGEHDGEPFIVMELLEGHSLADRLRSGALDVESAFQVGLGILAALEALHARGVIHRDLKPSNVFLTPHAVKLLDFGLARTDAELEQSVSGMTALTRSGMVLGTPRYMSPEQITGGMVDARTDVFAAGAVLFEMLAGRPAFTGRNVVEILHATLHEPPPALTGSPAIVSADRVLRRALAKRAEERTPTAAALAAELRAVAGVEGGGTAHVAQALTRLVVLPFRILRADPETDFLAYSLADAIATSLAGFTSIVVRSTASATRFASESPDLRAIATEADVDRVVTGTLLRAGDQVRVTAQLLEAPAGTMLTSHTVQASLGDLFKLQDDLAHRVVDALALPLGAPTPTPDAPRDPRAYELYLRANELARSYDQLPAARDLYQRCVEMDPAFAPAWARLGRCHRVIGKYLDPATRGGHRAEEAFRRALELNPRLTIAHKLYANLEADLGQAPRALVRLLGEASRHGNDPELFAGLVHAGRYCGLFEQSIAAHGAARRLDPQIPTSLEMTLLLTGDLERLLTVDRAGTMIGGDDVIRVIGLGLAGRTAEAGEILRGLRERNRIIAFHTWADFVQAWLDRRPADMTPRQGLDGFEIMEDPEAIFQGGWLLCDAGRHDLGLAEMARGVRKGYYVAPTLATSHSFDAVRSTPAFRQILAEAEEGRARALAAFREHGGEELLAS